MRYLVCVQRVPLHPGWLAFEQILLLAVWMVRAKPKGVWQWTLVVSAMMIATVTWLLTAKTSAFMG